MRLLSSLLAVLATCTALLGCSARPPCLSGACPEVGNPTDDEMFRLVRRELDRSEAATPLISAHILEQLPSLFPSAGGRPDAPRCGSELVEAAFAATFDEAPVTFSRSLVARIRAVGNLHDTTESIYDNVVYLRRLAQLDEARLSDYQFSPGEAGPAPPKSFVRYAALSASLRYEKYWYGSKALFQLLQATKDDRVVWILHDAVVRELYVSISKTSGPTPDDLAKGLLLSWLSDMQWRLNGSPDPLSLEIVLQRMLPLAVLSPKLGAADDARKLLEAVLAVRGELPLARGVPGAARDLAAEARLALFHFEAPDDSDLERLIAPSPARDVLRPDAMWRGDPAPARPPAEAIAARMRDLEGDLLELKFARGRCHVLQEQAFWAPPADADRLFDRMVAPLSRGGKVAFSAEALCRMSAAASVRAAPESKRAGLVLRWLRAEPSDIAEWDRTGDSAGSVAVPDTGKEQIKERAASILAENLEWIERHAELRAWLSEEAKKPISLRSSSSKPGRGTRIGEDLHLAYERLLLFHTSVHPEASIKVGRAILRAWIERARAALAAGSVIASDDYGLYLRLFALGDFAARFGLRDEAQDLFDAMAKPVEPPPAKDSPARYAPFAQEATLASLLMSFTGPG